MSKMAEVAAAKDRIQEIAQTFWVSPEDQRAALNAEYDECVAAVLAYYGPTVPVAQIDPMLASEYGDFYKDRYFVRPSANTSYGDARHFVDNLPPLELEEDEDDGYDLTLAQDARDVGGHSPFDCLAALRH